MKSPYAAGTAVPVDRSKAEIERTLSKYGAEQFMYGTQRTGSFVAFKAHDRVIRFVVPMPSLDEIEIKRVPWKSTRAAAAEKKLDAEGRRRWRALVLCIKAKLEAVSSGIATFETEFMPYTMLANGKTVAEQLLPEVERALASDAMPRLAGLLEGPVKS